MLIFLHSIRALVALRWPPMGPPSRRRCVQVKWDAGTLVGETRYCRQILPDKYTIGLKIIGAAKPSKLKTRDLESAFE